MYSPVTVCKTKSPSHFQADGRAASRLGEVRNNGIVWLQTANIGPVPVGSVRQVVQANAHDGVVANRLREKEIE